MCVGFIGEAKDGDDRILGFAQNMIVEHPQGPEPAVAAVGLPGTNDPEIGAGGITKANHRRQVALQIAAGEAETGRDIGVLADALIEPERRGDLRPIGPDMLAELGHGVGDGNGADEADPEVEAEGMDPGGEEGAGDETGDITPGGAETANGDGRDDG